LLFVPQTGSIYSLYRVSGIALIALGEFLRLWGVHHIGVISRTRSDRLGPLVVTGPFGYLRNPLYVGNIALWVGFAFLSGPPWMAPIVFSILVFEYQAIVRWEERLLEARFGEGYREYARRVPRWLPRLTAGEAVGQSSVPYSWRETVFSERGTLAA